MELACGYRPKNEIKMKRLKTETIGSNSNTLLIIRLPSSLALRVLSRSLFLAMLILSLPCIWSILRAPSNSLDDYEENGFGSHSSMNSELLPLIFRDLSDEGLLKKGNRALILSSGVEDIMDYSDFLNENIIDLTILPYLDYKSSIHYQKFDFVVALRSNDVDHVDRVLPVGGLLVMQLSDDPSNSFPHHSNYKTVYLRRFESTVVAMRKTGLMEESVNFPIKLPQCGSMGEAKKAALKGLEDVLLEPPRRKALANSINYSKKIKFLPDLLGDSLESYQRRVFITHDNGVGVQWFYQNYPTRNQYFEVYNLEIEVYDLGLVEKSSFRRRMMKEIGVSDWLRTNVREEDFVVIKAEAQLVEDMMRDKTICLVDELLLECKNQWDDGVEKNEVKRAYWECLALYGKLREEGVAVHQWWG